MARSFVILSLLGVAFAQDLSAVIAQYKGSAADLDTGSAPWGPDNSTDVVSSVAAAKRQEPTACVDQVGNGPHVDPDTDTDFMAYSAFSAAATAAANTPPDRFSVVPSWIDLKGSNGDNTGYLTYVQSQLSSYDAGQCATICDEMTDCVSFVIYFERDPELVWPTTHAPKDPECPASADSSSVTLTKCAFYSVPLYSSNATNTGQYQDGFHLVVAGSTAFNMEAPAVSGWTGPVALHDAAIDIPPPVGEHGYIRVQTFPNDKFDPNTCAASCAAIEQCTMFDAYVLYENGINGYVSVVFLFQVIIDIMILCRIFTCVYYSQNYGASYATVCQSASY